VLLKCPSSQVKETCVSPQEGVCRNGWEQHDGATLFISLCPREPGQCPEPECLADVGGTFSSKSHGAAPRLMRTRGRREIISFCRVQSSSPRQTTLDQTF